ncbi:MAG: hypothetical protein LBI33_12255 [Propionibacteriaceae bacterium]|jgi:hypothetical protein|nr:hypothetical protein [Propionibacteriaceae bacterium]
MTTEAAPSAPRLTVEYEGTIYEVNPDTPFDIGREGDLGLDHNPYLHRRLLRLAYENDFWWLANVGGGIGATVYDQATRLQAWLGPSSRVPLVFDQVEVVFTAGPCTYRLAITNDHPRWQEGIQDAEAEGDTTIREVGWTAAQKLAVLALAEPMLLREGFGVVHIPSNAAAAERIGWASKRFEKKVDNVCAKLDRLGIDGMRGGVRQHASGRRARLVEWAISAGFVTQADLSLLDNPDAVDDDEAA